MRKGVFVTRIYLIRHCEAEGNIYRRAQGWYDSNISPKGARQIDALAERFRGVAVDALYSSDLLRARRTAGAVTRYHDLPLHATPRLREMNLGAWEDRPFGDVGHESPALLAAFNGDPDRWSVPGAESFAELKRRMGACIREIAAAHAGQTVVCVSHGMAIRALLADIVNAPSERIDALVPHGDNTAVSLLELEDGETRVAYMNDASHLTGDLSTFSRQSWWKDSAKADPNNVYFRRLDPAAYPSTYLSFYEKTWLAVHGDLEGFRPAVYLENAKKHVLACPDALVAIVRPEGEVVGVTELDVLRGREEGAGWICLCYVEEACRRSLLGVQLIGHAVSVFRRQGFRTARLNVFEGNTGARRFYEAYEFRPVGEAEGVAGKLLIMEKDLQVR